VVLRAGQRVRATAVPGRRELGAAAVLAVLVLVATAVVVRFQGIGPLEIATAGAVLVAAAAWSWHRVAPVGSAVVVVAVVVGYVVAGLPYGPVLVLPVLACFAVARFGSAAQAVPTCVAAGLGLAGALWTRLDGVHLDAAAALLVAWPGVFVAVPALAGALVRTRARSAARERAALLARGADEERLRVAREVHDIAGHGFAVVAMQAGVALTVLDEEPAQARLSLEAVRATAERALHELQAALDTLHADAPTADDVPELVDRIRSAGLPVGLSVTGDAGAVVPEVSTAVYRLVQEALTNVLRHAGPTAAEVAIGYGDEVAVEVRDHGAGGDGADAGRGLRGLRERVERLHGRFTAAAAPDGGYAVSATIPNPRGPR
jgi:signal transduction histidine kinase